MSLGLLQPPWCHVHRGITSSKLLQKIKIKKDSILTPSSSTKLDFSCVESGFTTVSSSGTHRSLRSLCSALGQVVFFTSNLSLNLNPAITWRDHSWSGNTCEAVITECCPSSQPVYLSGGVVDAVQGEQVGGVGDGVELGDGGRKRNFQVLWVLAYGQGAAHARRSLLCDDILAWKEERLWMRVNLETLCRQNEVMNINSTHISSQIK